jgi:peroxiredoxin Q/BCP
MTIELMVGDAAPDFRLRDYKGCWTQVRDFAPGKLILFFYPAALTPGCTVEAIDFTAAGPDFKQAGYTTIGISPDEPETLARFISLNKLDVLLLADPSLTTIQAYGAWGDRSLWGKVITGVIRSTILVEVVPDGQGQIIGAHYGIRATGHVGRLRAELGLDRVSAN